MSTRFIVSSDVCSATDKDGTTIFDVKAGKLYSLIGLGSAIWNEVISHPEGVMTIELVNTFDPRVEDHSQTELAAYVETLIGQLSQHGIIDSIDGQLVQDKRTPFWPEILTQSLITSVKLLIYLRLVFLAALLQLFVVDLGLRRGGFRLAHHLVKRWPIAVRAICGSDEVQKVCRTMDHAVRYYPGNTACLQRSSVLTCLLRSHGVAARMVIGCRKIPFKGHAWVEVDGTVVNDQLKVQSVCGNILLKY